MPFTKKGKEIMGAMDKEYGKKKGEEVFYASRNAGKIEGVEKGDKHKHQRKAIKRLLKDKEKDHAEK